MPFAKKGLKKVKCYAEGQGAFVDLKRRVVVLELKPEQDVPLDAFTQVIKDAGYAVNKVEKVEQSIIEIKSSIKASTKGQ